MSSLLPITLGIARPDAGNSFLPFDPARRKIRADIRDRVLARDEHSCRFCGFHAQKYQEVAVLNGDYGNLKPENLATACVFCHQCFDLELTTQMRSGVLVWLPEISQSDLHHVARAVYVARISQGPMADTAKHVLDLLMARREEARRRISTDDPYVLAAVLRDYLPARSYVDRNAKLDGIRLFPLDRRIIKEADLEFNQFPQILAFWRSKDGPFGGRIPAQWIDLFLDAA